MINQYSRCLSSFDIFYGFVKVKKMVKQIILRTLKRNDVV